tara:strand:- start:1719 stop:2939 length:1221 start_codon:yes stop_codon:yes gene_type:complete
MELEKAKTRIAVFGGGRWARVLLGVFLAKTKSNVKFTVHTKHLVGDMRLWINNNGFGDRVFVTDADPDFFGSRYKAAVVVNSVGGHKRSAKMAIAAKVPVLVEKPMTPTFEETLALIQSAKGNGTLLSSSWVFLYASYIDNFIEQLGSADDIQKVRFNWTDKFAEPRYGEIKSFDAATPVFKDVLPHVLSILSKIFKNQTFEFGSCKVSRGGCCVEIVIFISNVECCLMLERNSDKRRRKIFIKGHKDFELDFSVEPGIISIDGHASSGDLYWSSSPSPLGKMVMEFLTEVESDKFDQQDTDKLALSTSKLIDEIEPAYLTSLDTWLTEHLNLKEIDKKDIHYFVSELVRGTLKVTYDKSDEMVLRYLDVIYSGQLLKDFQNVNTEVLDCSIIEFTKSLKADINLP